MFAELRKYLKAKENEKRMIKFSQAFRFHEVSRISKIFSVIIYGEVLFSVIFFKINTRFLKTKIY